MAYSFNLPQDAVSLVLGREVPKHPQLHDYLVAYAPDLTRRYLFPGRHGRSYIRVNSADRILR
ncbi:hypothetical protein ACSYAD_19375 [Acaryochloris marina NIES-2412]|uniref:hypothetical protein n=1 Tax=Acaryochloris marina TaxID=155978 RepID=UPI004059C654